MIQAYLFKLQDSGWECQNPHCKHDPRYHNHIIGKNFHLKQDETVLAIKLGDSREIYCRDCIDVIYQRLKPVLDSKLWPYQ